MCNKAITITKERENTANVAVSFIHVHRSSACELEYSQLIQFHEPEPAQTLDRNEARRDRKAHVRKLT